MTPQKSGFTYKSDSAIFCTLIHTDIRTLSLVPRPLPRFYLAVVCEIKSGRRPGDEATYACTMLSLCLHTLGPTKVSL